MAPRTFLTPQTVLAALDHLGAAQRGVSSTQVALALQVSGSSIKRALTALVSQGRVFVEGQARATRYRLPARTHAESAPNAGPEWSGRSNDLRVRLSTSPASRQPVTYRRDFVESYKPNHSFLLPRELCEELTNMGRLSEQLPAGTYVRKVLEQLLIDLSWSSSKLEGNRYSLLDTQRLFESGKPATDTDGVMLLNHKAAIEFLLDCVPTMGLGTGLLQNMHSVLMRDLLPDPRSLGSIRTKLVNISGTAYVPMQMPHMVQEMFALIVVKAQQVKNPVEAAFFLWVNLAYLQPFEDGNKRVSRLAANIPLMLYNQAPLSFLDVDRQDYALAMMAVYEFCDVSMAADLFAWTYRRSQAKYKVVLEAMGAPDPFRIAYRDALSHAVLFVVRERMSAVDAVRAAGIPPADVDRFAKMLKEELDALEDYNCARYRLRPMETSEWIQSGRPR